MARNMSTKIESRPESELIPLSTFDVYPGDEKPAANVHKHLIYGRAYVTGKIWTAESEEEFQRPTTQDSEGRDSTNYRIVVGLEHHRALILYARWIYGRPMWDSADCTNPKGDLECLTDIYDLCAGDHNGAGRDHEAINACLDAIREMLICDFSPAKPLNNPLGNLLPSLPPASSGRNMVVDPLAFGVCADEGCTETWHDNWYAKPTSLGRRAQVPCCFEQGTGKVEEDQRRKAGPNGPLRLS